MSGWRGGDTIRNSDIPVFFSKFNILLQTSATLPGQLHGRGASAKSARFQPRETSGAGKSKEFRNA
jgi:hypothetical protein